MYIDTFAGIYVCICACAYMRYVRLCVHANMWAFVRVCIFVFKFVYFIQRKEKHSTVVKVWTQEVKSSVFWEVSHQEQGLLDPRYHIMTNQNIRNEVEISSSIMKGLPRNLQKRPLGDTFTALNQPPFIAPGQFWFIAPNVSGLQHKISISSNLVNLVLINSCQLPTIFLYLLTMDKGRSNWLLPQPF